MNPSVLIIGLIVVAVTVYLIGYPLLKREEDPEPGWETNPEEYDLDKQKESVFTTLGEIEFDYRMKKLSEDDYNMLKNRYRKQAVNILQAEEEVKLDLVNNFPDTLEAEIEKEIEAEVEQELSKLQQSGKK
ncbi:MAG: hypothetical protein ACYCX4_15950 [Bacillota bacterium]